jgi:hypothetical protein
LIPHLFGGTNREHFVHAGEVLPPGHPVVKARPELFDSDVATPKSTRQSAK